MKEEKSIIKLLETMKRYILTLLSCMIALLAYGADDSNTVGKMREEGKSFYDSARDLLYELSPKEGENASRYKELGNDTREAVGWWDSTLKMLK